MQDFVNPLRDMIAHQTHLQTQLTRKCQPEDNHQNIAHTWTPMHLGINALDNVIEEAIEAKRHVKARKWWANPDAIRESNIGLMTMTNLRKAFVEELADIFICWINVLVYFSISPQEFVFVLESKMKKNNPDNSKSDIGNRS